MDYPNLQQSLSDGTIPLQDLVVDKDLTIIFSKDSDYITDQFFLRKDFSDIFDILTEEQLNNFLNENYKAGNLLFNQTILNDIFSRSKLEDFNIDFSQVFHKENIINEEQLKFLYETLGNNKMGNIFKKSYVLFFPYYTREAKNYLVNLERRKIIPTSHLRNNDITIEYDVIRKYLLNNEFTAGEALQTALILKEMKIKNIEAPCFVDITKKDYFNGCMKNLLDNKHMKEETRNRIKIAIEKDLNFRNLKEIPPYSGI